MQVLIQCIHEQKAFIIKHYFASKSFVVVREAFSNAFLNNEVPNKITMDRLVINFRYIRSVCGRVHVRLGTVLTGEKHRNFKETLTRSPEMFQIFSSKLDYLWLVLIERQNYLNYGHQDLQTSSRQSSFSEHFRWQDCLNNPWHLKELNHWPRNTLLKFRETHKKGKCLFSRRWRTFPASVVRLFCKFLLKIKKQIAFLLLVVTFRV